MSFGDEVEERTYIFLCRARQVTDGDQTTPAKIHRVFPEP